MQHDAEKYLVDILDAANDIAVFSEGMSYDEYQESKLVRAAIERKFEIIGEAMSRLSKESPETVGEIREFEKIIAFRNLVIHGCDIVSAPIVWDIIQSKLPSLVDDVKKLINS